jgi:hypothetical protein
MLSRSTTGRVHSLGPLRSSHGRARAVCGAALIGSLLFASSAWAEGVAPAQATQQQAEEADKKFQEGQKLIEQGDFDSALVRFRESHDIVARPDSSLMIARVLRDTGQLVEARAEFEKALTEAKAAGAKYKTTLADAKRDLADIDATLVRLNIELVNAPPGTTLSIDGEPVTQDISKPVLVTPGSLQIVAQTPAGKEAGQRVNVTAGESKKVRLVFPGAGAPPAAKPTAKPQSKPPPSSFVMADSSASSSGGFPMRTMSYVAGGVGVAGLAVFGIFGAMSNSKFSDLEDSCPDGHCTPDRQGDIDDGKQFQTIANIGLIVGVVGVGAGVTLFILSGSQEETPTAATAQLGLGVGSVQLNGRF